jgi:hypothetical protein
MTRFSSRNWRRLDEPAFRNQATWEWAELQREWATEAGVFFGSWTEQQFRDVLRAEILTALSGQPRNRLAGQ